MLMDEPNKKINLTGQLVTHFSLSGDPFSIESSCFFEGAQRKHNLETLRHLAIFGDMVLLLTGEIGAGKTSLIERFVQAQDSELAIHVYKNPAQFIRSRSATGKLDNVGAIQYFSELLGLPVVQGEGASENLSRVLQHCNLKFQSTGTRILLVIDDADLLSKEELALFIRLFKSLPVESGVVLLLSGAPKLLRFASEDEDVDQDAKLHQIQLKPLTTDESVDYIEFRMASVGYDNALTLSDVQKENLAKMGKGLPGRINRFFAYIVFELGLPESDKPRANNIARKVMFAIAGLFLFSFVVVSYQYGLLDFSVNQSEGVATEKLSEEEQVNVEGQKLLALQREARMKMLDLAVQDSLPNGDELESEKYSLVESVSHIEKVVDESEVTDHQDRVLESTVSDGFVLAATEPLVDSEKTPPVKVKVAPSNQAQSESVAVLVEEKTLPIEKPVNQQQADLLKEEEKVAVSTVTEKVVPVKPIQVEDAEKNKDGFKHKSWVIAQSSAGYSAQLLGSYSEETAVKFIKRAGVLDPALYYLKTLYKGRDWYVVFYGNFQTKIEAQEAVLVAPQIVKKQGPWLRRFEGILNSYPK